MKVVALGKIAQNKLCNIPPGVPFKVIDSDLTVKPEIYIKLQVEGSKKTYDGSCVNLETGTLTTIYPSSRVQIFQDACIVLDPIDHN